MERKRIVVIGGTAAGPKAASRAKRLDQSAEVTLLQKAPELSMASCGYPYYVEGKFKDRDQLLSTPAGVVRDPAFFAAAKGFTAMVNTEATAIDRDGKTIAWTNTSGESGKLPYDKLIICTGALPKIPPIPGRDLKGVASLYSMKDADDMRAWAEQAAGKGVVIIGGGLIGVEAGEALTTVGAKVTLVEALPQILGFLDEEMALLVQQHATAKGMTVMTGVGIKSIEGKDGKVCGVSLADGSELACEMVVMAIGVKPNSVLAEQAGLKIGKFGGIDVDEYMQTSDPHIYAAGDCVEVVNRLTGQKSAVPFGDLANLEGRVAAENAILGNSVRFPGTVGSGICKVFDFGAGSTGLSERKARELGFDVVCAINSSPDKPGFMGAKLLISKMIAEKGTGRILGFSCVGPGEVNRQVSEMAIAVTAGWTVDEMSMADLPYAPPFSLAIDHAIATAHITQNKMRGLMTGITSVQAKALMDSDNPPFILDVRQPVEYEQMRLGVGETLIPLGQLRKRLSELPADKNAPILAYCKVSMRGYEAQRALEYAGYTNITVMEGGIMAWPFQREK